MRRVGPGQTDKRRARASASLVDGNDIVRLARRHDRNCPKPSQHARGEPGSTHTALGLELERRVPNRQDGVIPLPAAVATQLLRESGSSVVAAPAGRVMRLNGA